MGDYIVLQDLINALTLRTVKEIFDDNNDGVVAADDPGVVDVISRAEAQVDSYLQRAYGKVTLPVPEGDQSALLRQASLMFAIPYAFQRHPEYPRIGEARGISDRIKEAQGYMERLVTGRQYLNDVPNHPQDVPSTVGGIVLDNGPRIIVDGSDGTNNGGDY